MRRQTPVLVLIALGLGLTACSPKAEAPAAPAAPVAPATAEAPDTRPGHVRREAQAQSAQEQIEAQMQAQMQAEPAPAKSGH